MLSLNQAYDRGNYLNFLAKKFVFYKTLVDIPIPINNDAVEIFECLGFITTADKKKLLVFEIRIDPTTQLARNRVQLRHLVAREIKAENGVGAGDEDGALAVYIDRKNKQWRFSFISIEHIFGEDGVKTKETASKRFTYLLGEGAKTRTATEQFDKLNQQSTLDDLKAAFAVEALSKEFYGKLNRWYETAQQQVKFPNDENAENHIQTSLIRLLTRLLFVWFLKEKKLIDPDLFELAKLKNIIDWQKDSSFYKAILQNLFFATLNREITSRSFRRTTNGKANSTNYLATSIYRYQDYFSHDNEQDIMALFKKTPFLNGGLFECLDREATDTEKQQHKQDKSIRKVGGAIRKVGGAIRMDGFSDRPDNELQFDNQLLFNDDEKNLGLIDLFNQYQFTVEESTPTDVEVALDPELLGKVFENLLASYNPETGQQARKATGSFYTPREIVSYMVDESLKQYFKTHINLGKAIINNLFIEGENKLKEAEIKAVIKAIDGLKILDPAVGSGAFPMGILQRLVFILEKIDPENKHFKQQQLDKTQTMEEASKKASIDAIEQIFSQENQHNAYGKKLMLIENCIYGVDIQPIAIQICKLRFFISLTIEQKLNKNSANSNSLNNNINDNYGIKALPNLETKFIVANTLLPLGEMPSTGQMGLFDTGITKLQRDLAKIRHQYFTAKTLETKHKCRKKDQDLREKMLATLTQSGITPAVEATMKQVVNWDLYNQNAVAAWFEPEWMFGIKNGFDIVIGNPPYIKEYENKDAFNIVRENKKYYQGKMDIWTFFACIGIDILKENAVLSFIAPNNWVSNSGASKARNKILQDSRIIEFIDFGNFMIFENALIQTMIFILKKEKNCQKYTTKFSKVLDGKLPSSELVNFLHKKTDQRFLMYDSEIDTQKLMGNNITFLQKYISDILDKIEACKNFELDKDDEITNGLQVQQEKVNKKSLRVLGNAFSIGDGIFNLTNKEKDLLSFQTNELELIKPLYTSKEISRYYANKNNQLWVIYTNSKFKNSEHITPYPNLKKHLDKFQKVITTDNKPYGIHRTRNEFFFEGEKILSLRKSPNQPNFSYVDFDSYVNQAFYVIKSQRINLKYLIALLNSKLIAFWLRHKGKMQGDNYQIDKEPILNIPIKKALTEIQQPFIDLVDKILIAKKTNQDSSDLETQIDKLVYKLYNLTAAEIKILKNEMDKEKEEIQTLLQQIRDESSDADYIYRGETQKFPKISSTLYRKYTDTDKDKITAIEFDIDIAQKEILKKVKDYASFDKERDILIELQHYGGKTNLIDFSTDYLIALFFACDAEDSKDDAEDNQDGRLILLKKNTHLENITTPPSKNVRIISQKSIFFEPPEGFIAEEKVKIVPINQKLKQPILRYLKQYHRITTESIYNDLFGYIQNQDKHKDAYTQFYIGLTHHQQAGNEDAQEEYNKAIDAYTAAIELNPDYAAIYYNRGLAQSSLGQHQEAIADYTAAIELNPDNATAYYNRGNAKAKLGQYQKALEQYEEAITDYTTAIELKPDYADAYNNRGIAKADLRQYPEAITDYTTAIELKPDYADAYNNRGTAKADLKQYQEAITDYTTAIKLKPDYAQFYNNRGNAKAQLGQYQQAIADYTTAIERKPDYAEAYINRGIAKAGLGQYPEAITDHTTAIELKPDYAEAYISRGIAQVELGQHQQAITDYNTAIKLNPDSAEAYNNRGLAKEKLGQRQQAITDYTKAIERKPDSAEAYCNRGNAKEGLGQYQQAITDHTTAIELKPDNAAFYYNRGLAKTKLGQPQEAITDYTVAIKLKPNYAEAYDNRGNAKAGLGQYKKAITDHTAAIKLNPDYAEAYNNRGTVQADLGQYQKAIADYTAAIELRPDDAKAYNNRGNAQVGLEQYQEAIIDYTTAIKLKPDNAVAYNNRGTAKAELKQYQEAITDYNTAIKLKPDYAVAYDNRGIAKAGLGQYQKAIADHTTAIKRKPDYAVAYNNRGVAQAELEQYPEAIADYTAAIKLKPDYAEAYINRGIAKADSGQYQKAIADYTAAIKRNPDYAEAYINRGTAKAKLGRYPKAITDYTKAIELKPDYAEAYINRGLAQVKLGQHQEAITDYNTAIKLKPDDPKAYNNRGGAKVKLGQHQQAIADYTTAIKLKPDYAEAYNNRGTAKAGLEQYEEAITDYTTAIELNPDDAEAYNNRGNVQADLRQHQQAITDYTAAIELKPDHAAAYVNRGNAQVKLGQYQEAIIDYTTAIELKPDYADAYNNRGNVQADLRQHEEAIADYNTAIKLKPDYADAYNNRGTAKADLRQHEEAIADYNTAIKLKPDDAKAYNNRGNAHADLEQYQQAIADYNTAIKLKFDDAAVYYNRGTAKADLRQHQKAIADYSTAIKLKPDYAAAYFNRGNAQADLEQYQEAIADYTKAIELKPDDAKAYYNRGIAQADLERYPKAIADYTKAIRLKPDDAKAYYNRGNAQVGLERHPKAITDYTKAIKLKPDDAEAYNNRGVAKAELEQYPEAITDYTKAIKRRPDHVLTYVNRGNAKVKLGKHEQASADYTVAMNLAKKQGNQALINLINFINKK